jgi:hypothetical protein
MAILRNVAKTDTLESQRQKINLLAQDVYSIGSGGSDLSAGNIKLGDGARVSPSLSFSSDNTLGIYKPAAKTIGYVSDGKKLIDISSTAFYSFKDLILQKKILTTEGTIVTTYGSNYDPGTYNNIALIGGSGDGALANITVTSFNGEIFSTGSKYKSGTFSNISLVGGFGTGATAGITISPVAGDITNPGSGYTGQQYTNVPLTGGSGTGALATISIGGELAGAAAGTVVQVQITNSGQNYSTGNVLSANTSDLGGTGSGFQFTITSDPGKVTAVNFTNKGSGYKSNDILTLPVPVTGVTTNLKGLVEGVSTTLNTGSSVITVSSTTGILAGMEVTTALGSTGSVSPLTTVLTVNSLTQLTLSTPPTGNGAASLNFRSSGNLSEITVSSVAGIISGMLVSKTAGTGIIAANTTVFSVNSTTKVITLSSQPSQAGTATLTFTPAYGVPTTNFQYKILTVGVVEDFSISNGGNGYSLTDQLTVSQFDIVQPIVYSVTNKSVQKITFVGTVASSVFSVGDTIEFAGGLFPETAEIYKINTSGSNIVSIVIDDINLEPSDVITKEGGVTQYTVNTAITSYKYFIDTGSGSQITPNLVLYSGNTYNFNYSDSSNNGHVFSLSKYRDGIWAPSFIENVTATLTTTSADVVVSSTTGIFPGMDVSITGGSGSLALDTKVLSVNITNSTVTLTSTPQSNGSVTLSFRGNQFTDGVTRSNSILTIKITENTPNLYYYCGTQSSSHVDEGGDDNQESLLTINLNNPKVFGSGFSATVSTLSSTDIISGSVSSGEFTAASFISDTATFLSASITNTLNAPTIAGDSITANSITSPANLSLTATSVNVLGNFKVGTNIDVVSSTGNITTSGVLRTNGTLNVNNILTINNNNIATSTGNDIQLTPPVGRVAKVNTTTAIIIPSGNSSERPSGSVVANGAIRFNTDTNQYEGYSAATISWSSLGGVRDLDGNTYIAAEAFTGANDNILYFFNDNINTLKLSTSYLDFNTVKKIRSLNTTLPTYTNWQSNTPVSLGNYLKYRNNLYEVTTAGSTGTSGNEPVHTTGVQPNGTAQLTWYSSAVSPLTFEEISELQVGPLGNLPLVVNSELRLATNVISTDTNDLILRPNSGKKVTIDAATSLVIPAGATSSRGVAAQGSIRYSTSLSSFEGYNGTNWTSLGGVKDVDGNTYIIPETTPGANENILYFYNNGSNTLRVTTSTLEFKSIDSLTSTSENLNLNIPTVTFNNLAFTLDNTGLTTTKLLSTRTNLDFALSSGITADPLIRLNTTGDILINKSYSTGSNTFVKVLDNELKTFELDDVKVETFDLTLTKGATEFGLITIFTPSTHSGAKVVLIADNITTNDREVIEYNVVSKNGDIYHTEYGNVTTGLDLVSTSFDFDGSGNVRLTPSLVSSLTSGNVVNITAIKTIFKK